MLAYIHIHAYAYTLIHIYIDAPIRICTHTESTAIKLSPEVLVKSRDLVRRQTPIVKRNEFS